MITFIATNLKEMSFVLKFSTVKMYVLFLLALFPLLSKTIAFAQDRLPQIMLKSQLDLVLIPATVTDFYDHPVFGLQKEDFQLTEDKVKQKIVYATIDDSPVSVGIILDTSGSMEKHQTLAHQAVSFFLRISNKEDEFLLVKVADTAQLIQPLTLNWEGVQNWVESSSSKGWTALWDGLAVAIKGLKSAKNPRHVLLVISDGGDNHSRITHRQLKMSLTEANVQVYVIGIRTGRKSLIPWIARHIPSENWDNDLVSLADVSGGTFLEVDKIEKLSEAVLKMADIMKSQYVLSYTPTNSSRDGKYRRVQLEIVGPKVTQLKRHRLNYRQGYYGVAQ